MLRRCRLTSCTRDERQHLILPLLLCILLSSETTNADCFGAIFETIGSGFKYRAYLDDSSCSPNSTRVTRPYVAGACSKQHDNDFNGYPPACPPGDWNVMDVSVSTCEKVFANAMPKDIRMPSGKQPFDHGKVCNNGINSVIFVETNCTSLNASSVTMEQQAIGEYCWDGKTLSRGELAGIILAAIVGAGLIISLPLLVFSCYKRRLARKDSQASQRDIEATATGKGWKNIDPNFGFGLSSNTAEVVYSDDSAEEAYDVQLDTDSEDLGEVTGIPISQVQAS